MERSGYSDDCMEDQWAYIRYRGAVKSSLRGNRGQTFLKELLTALDSMPEKRLIADELEEEGSYCALGVVGKCRGIDLKAIDVNDYEKVAKEFGIAEALAREIMFENDDGVYWNATPENRWLHMHNWILNHLKNVEPQHQDLIPESQR